ncbi:MAG: bifunctional hydroxymethylpyrimidine kinase/phosphomethylpyrimidine kinase [Bradymonadales bacterium]|nr:bifunctional hydroxymethylpyrimidine kinase/phosphomethylpyrimidine kinase [Bradymonadales bacterium]
MAGATPRVLIVAGSDSGGGAGIQADIKTVTALGGYAATAVTALTAQDTLGVAGVIPTPPAFVQLQMRMILADIGADCIKTGMLHDAQVLEAVCQVLEREGQGIPAVIDPVMVAKGGAPLIDDSALERLTARLLPLSTLITPNLREAERLLSLPTESITDLSAMETAARQLLSLGCGHVLLKGGHLPGSRLYDLLMSPDHIEIFEDERLETPHTHGTGCTLASAIAVGLAAGMPTVEAVGRARRYLREAIRTAPGLGKGHGPVNHAHTVRPFEQPAPHREPERERDRERERG